MNSNNEDGRNAGANRQRDEEIEAAAFQQRNSNRNFWWYMLIFWMLMNMGASF